MLNQLFSGIEGMSIMLVIPCIMLAAALFLGLQATLSVVTQAQEQRIMNRRLQFKNKFENNQEAIVELRKSRGLDGEGNLALPMRRFNELVVRSGIQFNAPKFALMAFGLGAVAAFAAWYFSKQISVASLTFPVAAIILPLGVLKFLSGRRRKKMAAQLPDALQVVCRSLEAGHPVATAVALVAREMPDPIGSEFGMAADEISYGMSLTTAVARMADRVADPDVELFAATVRLQEKTGGNLTELLAANTNTIRDRQTLRLKVRAASSEGRASAMILGSAPFILLVTVHTMNPSFYGDVAHEPLIRNGFIGLFGWMAIGMMVMNKMINFKM